MSGAPLAGVYAALERAECRPRGPEHRFTALCPAHDDHTPSLSVREGADGRVLVHCFAGCEPERIVATLGLGMRDLFPAGHYNGRPGRRLPPAKPAGMPGAAGEAIDFLAALELADCRWVASVALHGPCPACGGDATWMTADRDAAALTCENGCGKDVIRDALAGMLKERRHG
jgi:hypothetical protein